MFPSVLHIYPISFLSIPLPQVQNACSEIIGPGLATLSQIQSDFIHEMVLLQACK
jgi:hypothetical protein